MEHKDRAAPYIQAARVLPASIRQAALRLDAAGQEQAEELRLRRDRPPTVVIGCEELELNCPPVEEDELRSVVERASQSSIHRVIEQMRAGFLTIQGGHRIGLCGEAVMKAGEICAIRTMSSLSIRIARAVDGLGSRVLPELMEEGRLCSTLLLAPPGAGKTTLLRELVRRISSGEGIQPLRVGLADERREVSALWEGRAQFDVGARTDIMSDCPKALGLEALLRGMNPQVLAADEITAAADVDAMAWAAGCGVTLLATAHGKELDDLSRRPLYRGLMELGVFRRVVVLENRGGERRARVEIIP